MEAAIHQRNAGPVHEGQGDLGADKRLLGLFRASRDVICCGEQDLQVLYH